MEVKSKMKSGLQSLLGKVIKPKSKAGCLPIGISGSGGYDSDLMPTLGRGRKGACTMSDDEVLENYRLSGDPLLGARIYNDHWHLVLGCARHILGDSAAAQDAAADIFMKAMARLRKETPQNLKGWLYTVTRNHCYEIKRREKLMPMVDSVDGLRVVDDRPDGSHLAAQQSALAIAVHRALSSLPIHQKTCVELFYLQECSYKEIAETEGYDLGEVKSYIQNGKRRLMTLLATARTQHFLDASF